MRRRAVDSLVQLRTASAAATALGMPAEPQLPLLLQEAAQRSLAFASQPVLEPAVGTASRWEEMDEGAMPAALDPAARSVGEAGASGRERASSTSQRRDPTVAQLRVRCLRSVS